MCIEDCRVVALTEMLSSQMTVLLQLSLCLLLVMSYGICTADRNQTYHVNSSTDLEEYLCNTTWSSQYLVFLLNSSITFTISPGNFCQVTSQATSIKVRSNSPTQPAIILCIYKDSTELPRRGLVFFNTSITLERLVFKNCGTYLTTIQNTTITDYLNSSSLYYASSHAAALVFVHCQVNITQVNIYSSYGFAMIGIDLYNSTIDSVSMSNSSHSVVEVYQRNHSIGSGLLLHYIDINNSLAIYDINIRNAKFSNNSDYNNYTCLADTYSSSSSSDPIVNAAGLTIVYTQQSHNQISVSVTESYFHNNIGSFAGGMFVLHYNTISVTNTSIINSLFHNNYNIKPCRGGSIAFYYSLSLGTDETQINKSLVYIINTSFSNNHIFQRPKNSHDQNYGAVFILVLNPTFLLHINLINCNFTKNYAAVKGTCLFARVLQFPNNCKQGNVSITLDSTIVTNNSQNRGVPIVSSACMFFFDKINRVNITGTSNFSNNYGSVISSKNTYVYLSGNLTFNNNYAMTGPAITLVDGCQLYFMSGIIAKFTNNSAESLGGAIYADCAVSHNKCAIQINSNVSQVVFSNNEAKRAGNSIYAQPIFLCSINNSNHEVNMEFYKQHFTFVNTAKSTNNYDISSISKQVLDGFVVSQYPQEMYPGQELFYCIKTIDALGRSAYSATAIYVVRNNSQSNIPKTTKLWLSFDDQEQLIQEGKNCTVISMTVHTNDEINIIDGIIIFSQPTSLTKSVKIYPCPLGFELNKTIGICQLSSSFDNLRKHQPLTVPIVGNVSSQTITRLFGVITWAGTIEYENKTKTRFGVSLTCPIGYCDSNHTLPYFYSGNLSSKQSFKLSDGITDYHPPLCLYQREGTLCGRCSEGLSVVFGSTECRYCSNAWIASIGIYLITGPLLIYLLFALRLTLTTGTLNGIIFYIQAANCGLLDVLQYHYFKSSIDHLSEFAIFIIHVLNLETGFPLCFYNGMTELWKTGLNLAFPIYLLIIVVVLIIYSHFSLRISNRIAHSSVQVLVTVVHISFSSLLGQLINVMTYSVVYTSNDIHHVWFFDGSIEYGGHSHRILMMVTLIVVFSLLLPYILLLLFAKPLRPLACTTKYLRPFLEAIHAPYKEGKQYWFTLRLLLLCAMYGIYSRYRATDIYVIYFTTSPMLVVFLLLQVYIKPFKNKLVYMLDSWMMINLTFHYLTNWYFLLKENLLTQKIFSVTSVFLTFVTLLIVITYHVLWAMGKVYHIKRWIENKWEKVYLFYIKLSSSRTRIRIINHLPITDSSNSFYGSCSEFREPVLNYND